MTTTTSTAPRTCGLVIFTDSRDMQGHKCGRAVVADGLCGLHLAAKLRAGRSPR